MPLSNDPPSPHPRVPQPDPAALVGGSHGLAVGAEGHRPEVDLVPWQGAARLACRRVPQPDPHAVVGAARRGHGANYSPTAGLF